MATATENERQFRELAELLPESGQTYLDSCEKSS